MRVKIKTTGKKWDEDLFTLDKEYDLNMPIYDNEGVLMAGYIVSDINCPMLIYIPKCAHLDDGSWEVVLNKEI